MEGNKSKTRVMRTPAGNMSKEGRRKEIVHSTENRKKSEIRVGRKTTTHHAHPCPFFCCLKGKERKEMTMLILPGVVETASRVQTVEAGVRRRLNSYPFFLVEPG